MIVETSLGALVPSVKAEAKTVSENEGTETGPHTLELDKDFLCPICMQIIKDAFLTGCGHSFCYMCIVTHLNNKSDCPCCGHYLTNNQLFPNFLLNKLLKKTSARQIAKTASPVEHLRLALQQKQAKMDQSMNIILSIMAMSFIGDLFVGIWMLLSRCSLQLFLVNSLLFLLYWCCVSHTFPNSFFFPNTHHHFWFLCFLPAVLHIFFSAYGAKYLSESREDGSS